MSVQLTDQNYDFKTWLKVSIQEYQTQTHELFHLGTLYGKRPHILGIQLAKILKSRWRLTELRTSTDRELQELEVFLAPERHLLIRFMSRDNLNRRSLAQSFGTFVRALGDEYTRSHV